MQVSMARWCSTWNITSTASSYPLLEEGGAGCSTWNTTGRFLGFSLELESGCSTWNITCPAHEMFHVERHPTLPGGPLR
jgi:hypothetical protein